MAALYVMFGEDVLYSGVTATIYISTEDDNFLPDL